MAPCAIQIVMGPAGSGKSTYCQTIQEHCATLGRLRRRRVHVGNLDPAAEEFKYDVAFDIRDLISVDEVMEELKLGPNGALLFCMDYLCENADWLRDELENFDEDQYLLLDCPGQIEVCSHVPVLRRLVDLMKLWGYASTMVSVFVIDATFVCDAPKFISGSLLSLSAMVAMELPHVNVLSKCDLVDEQRLERILDVESASMLWGMEQDRETFFLPAVGAPLPQSDHEALQDDDETTTSEAHTEPPGAPEQPDGTESRRQRWSRLTESICGLLDDYSMVGFVPLNINDEDTIDHVLSHVDHTIQWGENTEVRGAEMDDDELMPGQSGGDEDGDE